MFSFLLGKPKASSSAAASPAAASHAAPSHSAAAPRGGGGGGVAGSVNADAAKANIVARKMKAEKDLEIFTAQISAQEVKIATLAKNPRFDKTMMAMYLSKLKDLKAKRAVCISNMATAEKMLDQITNADTSLETVEQFKQVNAVMRDKVAAGLDADKINALVEEHSELQDQMRDASEAIGSLQASYQAPVADEAELDADLAGVLADVAAQQEVKLVEELTVLPKGVMGPRPVAAAAPAAAAAAAPAAAAALPVVPSGPILAAMPAVPTGPVQMASDADMIAQAMAALTAD